MYIAQKFFSTNVKNKINPIQTFLKIIYLFIATFIFPKYSLKIEHYKIISKTEKSNIVTNMSMFFVYILNLRYIT